jgi:hypothetical protein
MPPQITASHPERISTKLRWSPQSQVVCYRDAIRGDRDLGGLHFAFFPLSSLLFRWGLLGRPRGFVPGGVFQYGVRHCAQRTGVAPGLRWTHS